MDPAKRVVTTIPLRELWDGNGTIALRRGRLLSAADIKRQLRGQPVSFVVANVGQPLTWVAPSAAYRFWKEEAQPHLVDPAAATDGFSVDQFADGYAYVASEWSDHSGLVVIVLEKHH